MLFRTALFVLAVVAFHGVARFIAIIIALVLPWVAVVVANGGPPLGRAHPSLLTTGTPTEAPPQPQLEPGRHPVVDGDLGDSDVAESEVESEVDDPPPPRPSPPSPSST